MGHTLNASVLNFQHAGTRIHCIDTPGAADGTEPGLHVLAHVFKVTVDPYVGRVGIFRVHQGTVSTCSVLCGGGNRKPLKVGHLFRLQGKAGGMATNNACGRSSPSWSMKTPA